MGRTRKEAMAIKLELSGRFDFFAALKIDRLFETFFALARDGKLNKGGAPNIFRTGLILLHFKNEMRVTQPNWALQKFAFNLLSSIARIMGYKAFYE
jgi:hypothetical protein